ncbi:MAG: AAA family ATPase [Thermoleophilia bacterium]
MASAALDSAFSKAAILTGSDVRQVFQEAALEEGSAVHAKAALPVGILMSEVVPERISWLWQGYIPLGKLAVLDGDPGQGKSTLAFNLAARVSIGRTMPDGSGGGQPGGVVILSAEDGLGDTIRPRLEAAGAELNRIVALSSCPDNNGQEEHPPVLPDDLDWIEKAIERVDAKLVIIDPLMAFLSGDTNSHRDQDIRRVLARMAALAEGTGAAILVIRHLNKSAGGPALYRGGGSIGIIGAARSGLLVARDPEQEQDGECRVLASTKCNLGPKPESLSFHLEQAENDASRVVWDGASSHDASALLSQADDSERGALEEAREVLESILEAGPVSVKEAKRLGREAGISERTLQRAKEALKVGSSKQGMHGGWVWELPKIANGGDKSPINVEDSQPPSNGNLGTLRESGNLHEPELPQKQTLTFEESGHLIELGKQERMIQP